jgi:hypothetical protein
MGKEELKPTPRQPSKYSVTINYLHNSSLGFVRTVFMLAVVLRGQLPIRASEWKNSENLTSWQLKVILDFGWKAIIFLNSLRDYALGAMKPANSEHRNHKMQAVMT